MKRSSLGNALKQATAAKNREKPAPRRVITTIALPQEILERLRRAAAARGPLGERMSVSAVIVELAEKHLPA